MQMKLNIMGHTCTWQKRVYCMTQVHIISSGELSLEYSKTAQRWRFFLMWEKGINRKIFWGCKSCGCQIFARYFATRDWEFEKNSMNVSKHFWKVKHKHEHKPRAYILSNVFSLKIFFSLFSTLAENSAENISQERSEHESMFCSSTKTENHPSVIVQSFFRSGWFFKSVRWK